MCASRKLAIDGSFQFGGTVLPQLFGAGAQANGNGAERARPSGLQNAGKLLISRSAKHRRFAKMCKKINEKIRLRI
jgi:hypothetical protein